MESQPAYGPFDPVRSLADLRHEFGEHGGVNMSIESSTTFTVLEADQLPKLFQGKLGPDAGGFYLYGRHYNPTVYVLGRELAALEGTEAGYCTASGMSAISTVVMQCCNPGDHIVASDTLYGGTYALLHDFLPLKCGIETSFAHVTDHEAIENAFTDKTKLLYVESMSNPTLMVADIPRLAEIAHSRGVRLVVDNTFSPMILSPGALGADIVVHSLTKFINGASDIIAGAVCADQSLIDEMTDLHTGALMLLGPTVNPKTAFEISLRLPHLGIRMTEHSRRALTFSQRLEEMGARVTYPGLPSHPQYDLLNSLRNEGFGHGGIFGIDLGTKDKAFRFMNILQNDKRFGYIAVSLGFFDTLMSCSACSTSSEMPVAEQDKAGIPQGFVRISIGYTGTLEQRWTQLREALSEVGIV